MKKIYKTENGEDYNQLLIDFDERVQTLGESSDNLLKNKMAGYRFFRIDNVTVLLHPVNQSEVFGYLSIAGSQANVEDFLIRRFPNITHAQLIEVSEIKPRALEAQLG